MRLTRKKRFQLCGNRIDASEFALPNHQHPPTELGKGTQLLAVSGNITLELTHPESLARLRAVRESTTPVPVPEAAVYKNNALQSWQDDVGTTRQLPYMEPVPIPHLVNQGSHEQFRLRVCCTNPRHVPAASLGSQTVRHNH